MDYNNVYEEAYNNYFGEKPEEISQVVSKRQEEVGIIKNEKLCAEGNISTVNKFGDTLRKLLNVIWGTDWGEIVPETASNEDKNTVKLPRITYSTNLREVSEGRSPKPTLEDVKPGTLAGYPTGEAYKIYRQNFDCIVEFNIRAETSKDVSELAEMFEDAMVLHAGFLKRMGISEIFFLKEVPPRYSNFFVESIPTKTLYFFVRLEKVRIVSTNTLRELEVLLDEIRENSDDNGMEFTIQK